MHTTFILALNWVLNLYIYTIIHAFCAVALSRSRKAMENNRYACYPRTPRAESLASVRISWQIIRTSWWPIEILTSASASAVILPRARGQINRNKPGRRERGSPSLLGSEYKQTMYLYYSNNYNLGPLSVERPLSPVYVTHCGPVHFLSS